VSVRQLENERDPDLAAKATNGVATIANGASALWLACGPRWSRLHSRPERGGLFWTRRPGLVGTGLVFPSAPGQRVSLDRQARPWQQKISVATLRSNLACLFGIRLSGCGIRRVQDHEGFGPSHPGPRLLSHDDIAHRVGRSSMADNSLAQVRRLTTACSRRPSAAADAKR